MRSEPDINDVIEQLKAELGSLVFQLAVKEATIKKLERDAKTAQPQSSERTE